VLTRAYPWRWTRLYSLLIPPSCRYLRQREGKKRSFPAKRIFLSYHDVENTYFDLFLLLSRHPASILYINQGSDHQEAYAR